MLDHPIQNSEFFRRCDKITLHERKGVCITQDGGPFSEDWVIADYPVSQVMRLRFQRTGRFSNFLHLLLHMTVSNCAGGQG